MIPRIVLVCKVMVYGLSDSILWGWRTESGEVRFLVLRLRGEKELLLVYGQELLCSTMSGRAPCEARAKAL